MPSVQIQFPCSGGIDEAVRAEHVDPTASWLNLENVRQPQRGIYDKRYGFAFLSSSRSDATTRTAGYALLTHNGNPCVIDGLTLDSYSPSGGVNFQRARVPECTARRRPLASRTYGLSAASDAYASKTAIAYANGYYIAACLDQTSSTNTAINAMVIDATSGDVVSSARVPTSSTTNAPMMKLVAVGNDVVCVWDDGAGGLWGSRLSVASTTSINAGWAARVSLAANYLNGAGALFDACALTTRFVVSYTNSGGGATRVTTATYDSTVNALTQLQTTTSVTPNASITGVSCDGAESNVVWIAFAASTLTAIFAEGRNPTTIGSITITQANVLAAPFAGPFRITVGYTGTDECWLAASNVDSSPSAGTWIISMYEKVNKSGGGAAQAGFAFQRVNGWAPASKPFKYGSRVYMEWLHHDTASTAVALFDVTTASGTIRPVAWTAPRLHVYSDPALAYAAHNYCSPSSTVRAHIGAVRGSSISGALIASEYDFANTARWRPASGAGCLLIGGGVPYAFDGQCAAEMTFIVPPRVDVTTAAGPGLTGTYTYTALYEFADAAGNVIWSDTAPAKSVTLANQNTLVTVQMLSSTWRDGTDTAPLEPQALRRVRIKVYRTQTGGGLFYLVNTIVNVPGGTDVQFTDSLTDAAILAFAQPYRSPGVSGTAQQRQCPPCVFAWTEYNGQIVALGDDLLTYFYTPQHVQGEQIYFSDVFQFTIEQDGPGTAIAAMDGTCFLFKRRAIYAVSGEPASDNGAQGGLGTPRRLACDVGCIDPRSVVVTAKGIFFQSDRGLELLTRAQTVEFVGEQVRVTTAAFPVCTAATLDPGQSRVYFEMAATETANQVSGGGRTLVFNLAIGIWESKDRRTSASAVADTAAQSAALINTTAGWRYAWLDTAGVLYYEDRTTYLDPGSTWVAKLGETGHVKPNGLMGQGDVAEVMLLAKSGTDGDIFCALRHDYGSYKTAQTKNNAAIAALGLPNVQLAFRPDDDAHCEAVAVKFYDAAPSNGGTVGTGRGAPWLGVLVDVTPTEGAYDLPDAAR